MEVRLSPWKYTPLLSHLKLQLSVQSSVESCLGYCCQPFVGFSHACPRPCVAIKLNSSMEPYDRLYQLCVLEVLGAIEISILAFVIRENTDAVFR